MRTIQHPRSVVSRGVRAQDQPTVTIPGLVTPNERTRPTSRRYGIVGHRVTPRKMQWGEGMKFVCIAFVSSSVRERTNDKEQNILGRSRLLSLSQADTVLRNSGAVVVLRAHAAGRDGQAHAGVVRSVLPHHDHRRRPTAHLDRVVAHCGGRVRPGAAPLLPNPARRAADHRARLPDRCGGRLPVRAPRRMAHRQLRPPLYRHRVRRRRVLLLRLRRHARLGEDHPRLLPCRPVVRHSLLRRVVRHRRRRYRRHGPRVQGQKVRHRRPRGRPAVGKRVQVLPGQLVHNHTLHGHCALRFCNRMPCPHARTSRAAEALGPRGRRSVPRRVTRTISTSRKCTIGGVLSMAYLFTASAFKGPIADALLNRLGWD
jgi:hypothetical protein